MRTGEIISALALVVIVSFLSAIIVGQYELNRSEKRRKEREEN